MYFFMRLIISTLELEHKYQMLYAVFAQFRPVFLFSTRDGLPAESLAAA